MVSPIASHSGPAHQVHAPRTAPAEPGAGPGKSAESIGHQAKAAIAEVEGGNLGANIQGQIASMMAHRLDVSAVLSPPASEQPVDDVPADDPPPELQPAAVGGGTDSPAAADALVLLTAETAELPDTTP